MKLLFDFFPILLFFLGYKLWGIYAATIVAIVANLIQVAAYWIWQRRVETSHLIGLGLIVVFGGATLLLQEEIYIKWKPTVLNWLFAVAFFASQYIGERPLVERMMGASIELPRAVWLRLNLSWVIFFAGLGVANLYVMYNFDTDTWVDFKLFGMMGLTILFVLLQAFYLARHIKPEEQGQ